MLINLWACSMGAYFSLLAYKDEKIKQCLFLSPVVNMKIIIDNMMLWSNTTEEELMKKKEIKTDFGQTLYWDYYLYVKEKPITNWNKKTYILYGNKDNMQNEETIKSFSDKFNCELNSRHVAGVHGDEHVPQGGVLLALQHLQEGFFHNFKPFCHIYLLIFLKSREAIYTRAELKRVSHGSRPHPTSTRYIATAAGVHGFPSFLFA